LLPEWIAEPQKSLSEADCIYELALFLLDLREQPLESASDSHDRPRPESLSNLSLSRALLSLESFPAGTLESKLQIARLAPATSATF